MTKLYLSLLMAGIAFLLASCIDRGDAVLAEQEFSSGVAFFEARELDAAEQAFLSAIETDPSLAKAYFNLGLIAEMEEDWQAAIGHYTDFIAQSAQKEAVVRAKRHLARAESALEADKSPEGRSRRLFTETVIRGQRQLDAGNVQAAFSSGRAAVELDANNRSGYLLAAAALARNKSYANARMFLAMALPRIHEKERGIVEQRYRQYGMAMEAENAIGMARKKMASGDFDAAADILRTAWQANPLDDSAALESARAWLKGNRPNIPKAALSELAASSDATISRDAQRILKRIRE